MTLSVLEGEGLRTLGQRIRICRQIRGYRALDFAALLGISQNYLSLIENDQGKRPSLPLLQRMGQALGVTTSQLLGETPLM